MICPICKTKWISGQGSPDNRRDRGDSALKCYLCWGLEEPEIRLKHISKKRIEEHKEKSRRLNK